jgi:uncharacterized protein (TIGR03437 family)
MSAIKMSWDTAGGRLVCRWQQTQDASWQIPNWMLYNNSHAAVPEPAASAKHQERATRIKRAFGTVGIAARFVGRLVFPIFIIAAVTTISGLNLGAQPRQYDHLYVFGDSLSDTGNYYGFTQGQMPASPPYYQGRFSNGPVWAEYLARDLGLSSQLGDYAANGATSGLTNAYASDPSLPLYGDGALYQLEFSLTFNPKADPNALYVFWAGLSDYVPGPQDPQVVVGNIVQAVNLLANAGAKSILVGNLPDLGALPETHANAELSSRLTSLTSTHNAALTAQLALLRQTFPDVNIIELDVNSQFREMMAHPANYGLANTTDSCIGNTGFPLLPPSNVSSDCSADARKFLFWDSINPTTTGHRYIATLAFSILSATAAAPGGVTADGIGVSSVRNAANDNSALSAGSPITIIGYGLASAVKPAILPLTTQVDSTTVVVGGIPSPLFYVAPGMIKAQLPWEIQPGETTIIVANGGRKVTQTIQVSPVSPAIFTEDAVHAAAFNQDGSSNITTPAAPGSIVGVYATGLGSVVPAVATGATASSSAFAIAADQVTAAVDGEAATVTFAGLAPGTVGFYQVNVLIPPDTKAGLVPIAISVDGQASSPVMISVHP